MTVDDVLAGLTEVNDNTTMTLASCFAKFGGAVDGYAAKTMNDVRMLVASDAGLTSQPTNTYPSPPRSGPSPTCRTTELQPRFPASTASGRARTSPATNGTASHQSAIAVRTGPGPATLIVPTWRRAELLRDTGAVADERPGHAHRRHVRRRDPGKRGPPPAAGDSPHVRGTMPKQTHMKGRITQTASGLAAAVCGSTTTRPATRIFRAIWCSLAFALTIRRVRRPQSRTQRRWSSQIIETAHPEPEWRFRDLRAESDSREIYGLVVPYNVETTIGGRFREVVTPGVFGDIEQLNTFMTRQHKRELTLGRTGRNVFFRDTPEGLEMRAEHSQDATGGRYAPPGAGRHSDGAECGVAGEAGTLAHGPGARAERSWKAVSAASPWSTVPNMRRPWSTHGPSSTWTSSWASLVIPEVILRNRRSPRETPEETPEPAPEERAERVVRFFLVVAMSEQAVYARLSAITGLGGACVPDGAAPERRVPGRHLPAHHDYAVLRLWSNEAQGSGAYDPGRHLLGHRGLRALSSVFDAGGRHRAHAN